MKEKTNINGIRLFGLEYACAYIGHTNCMRKHTRTLQVCIHMQVACACIHTRNPKPKKPEQKTKKTQQK